MFAAQSPQGFGMGYRPDTPDPRDHIFGLTYAPHKLPAAMSLRQMMPPVYDQLPLGACTGNAIAGLMEYTERRGGDTSGTPSRLFIYYHERLMEGTVNEDAGAEIRDGLKVVVNIGVPPETDWPYDISRFAEAPPTVAEQDAAQHKALEYARITPGRGAPFRSALAAGHPIVFGFNVIQQFEDLSAGQPYLRLPGPVGENYVGWHAVLAVGYDFTLSRFPRPVVEVRNSWGDSWGEAGYFYMDAGYFTDPQLTSDFWTVKKAS